MREGKLRSTMKYLKLFIPYIEKGKIEKSRDCDICIIDIHRALLAKNLGSTMHVEEFKFITSSFFNESNKTNQNKFIILNI